MSHDPQYIYNQFRVSHDHLEWNHMTTIYHHRTQASTMAHDQWYSCEAASGVSIRRKDRLWDRLGTPERWSILGCTWSTFTHPNKNIHSSEIVLIFSYFTFFLQIFSSLATVFKADVQCVRRYQRLLKEWLCADVTSPTNVIRCL